MFGSARTTYPLSTCMQHLADWRLVPSRRKIFACPPVSVLAFVERRLASLAPRARRRLHANLETADSRRNDVVCRVAVRTSSKRRASVPRFAKRSRQGAGSTTSGSVLPGRSRHESAARPLDDAWHRTGAWRNIRRGHAGAGHTGLKPAFDILAKRSHFEIFAVDCPARRAVFRATFAKIALRRTKPHHRGKKTKRRYDPACTSRC